MNDTSQNAKFDASFGHEAQRPWQMTMAAWRQVLVRTWRETATDNIGLIAAGVAFYAFLALVPMLGAVVLTYGLFATPDTVARNLHTIGQVMPPDAARLVDGQLLNVVETSDGKKGLGVLLALAISLYGAMKGAGAIITALNIAYEEQETRGFVRLNMLTLGMTAAAVVVAVLALGANAALGYFDALLPRAPNPLLVLGMVVTYILFGLIAATAAATLYRFGPDRSHAQWAWLTPGSALSALLWIGINLGFGFYVANFGSYDATYGALGGVVVLLTWLYLSAYSLLLGAELNAELEHQTARDTTIGQEKALGQRRAVVADTVAD